MQLRNTNPVGAVDLPLIGRVIEAGEVFDVPDDLGRPLLDQVGNYELVKPKPRKPRTALDKETPA